MESPDVISSTSRQSQQLADLTLGFNLDTLHHTRTEKPTARINNQVNSTSGQRPETCEKWLLLQSQTSHAKLLLSSTELMSPNCIAAPKAMRYHVFGAGLPKGHHCDRTEHATHSIHCYLSCASAVTHRGVLQLLRMGYVCTLPSDTQAPGVLNGFTSERQVPSQMTRNEQAGVHTNTSGPIE